MTFSTSPLALAFQYQLEPASADDSCTELFIILLCDYCICSPVRAILAIPAVRMHTANQQVAPVNLTVVMNATYMPDVLLRWVLRDKEKAALLLQLLQVPSKPLIAVQLSV